MAALQGNSQLLDRSGRPLRSLSEINRLDDLEKKSIYARLLPPRLCSLLQLDDAGINSGNCGGRLEIIAPQGLGIMRIEARANPDDQDTVFFLDIADTQFHQMELAFCIICDPSAERFDVDVDEHGKINWFASHGRNVPEELRAFRAGLFPNQTRRGLHLFAEFFPIFERFADSLGMDMIVAEPLTYDNAIRYEKYGFDYLRGKKLMLEINREFRPGGELYRKLDSSTPFRTPGMERTVRGRSWAIHDGVMSVPWDDVQIYKMIGTDAGIDTFPERVREAVTD